MLTLTREKQKVVRFYTHSFKSSVKTFSGKAAATVFSGL
jgi:hypothetical protein